MVFTFGDFSIDTDRYVLQRHGKEIPLEPKIFDVLRHLIENRDRVVLKEELLEDLWPGEFVTESVLPRCIATARKALGDGGRQQKWIQTAHGRGYRFIGQVSTTGGDRSSEEGRTTFVGRRREMEIFDAATSDALNGAGRLVAVSGEPGIGKTRTVDEALRRAESAGAEALEGRCFEGGGAPPFWPWVQVLRGWLAAVGHEEARTALGDQAHELLPLLPELGESPTVPRPALVDVDPASGRFQLFDAIRQGLAAASETRPVAIVLDDLHHADGPSLELLRFLADDLHRRRILVLATYRDVELRRGHPLSRLLGELARAPSFRRVSLRGLDVDDVATLLEGHRHGGDPRQLAESVHDMTGGNAFFVTEVASLLRSGDESALADPLPQGIREAVGRRLDQLTQSANSVLGVAATIGREFQLSVLARACEQDRDAVLGALDEATQALLIERRGARAGHYRFSHALVQQTLYDEIDTPKRIRLHEVIGAAFEALFGDGDDAPLDETAHHYYQAAASGRTDRAVHFARRAAERATQLFAFEDSVAKYDQAIEALALSPDSSASSRVHCELLLAKGDQESRAGERDLARETFLRAFSRARESGDDEILGRAALGFGGRGEMGLGGDGRTAQYIEEAIDRLGDRHPALRAQLLGRLAGAPPYTYSMSRRRELSEESLRLARESGDPTTLTLALSARGWALMGPDRLEERLSITDELLEIARRPGGRGFGFLGYDPCFLAHENRYLAYLCLGDMRAAGRELTELESLAEELRQPLYHWYVSFFRTSAAITGGDYPGALRLLAEAEASQSQVAHPSAPFVLAGLRLWIGAQRGEFVAVEEGMKLLYDNTLTLKNLAKSAEAMICSLMGNLDDARRAYEQVADDGFGSIERDEAYLVQLGFLAELALDFGDRERAAQLLELLRPYTHLNATIEVLRVCDGAVSAYAGQAATAMGAYDEAEGFFAQGLAVNERMGFTSAIGSLRYHWAAMLVRRRRPADLDRAKVLLGEADQILDGIGHLRRLVQVRSLRSELA